MKQAHPRIEAAGGNGVEQSRNTMASITLCPRCSSHLELPSGIAPTSLVECPICEAEFLLASVAPRAIPKVRVVEHESLSAVGDRRRRRRRCIERCGDVNR
jgi:hypothetical protein